MNSKDAGSSWYADDGNFGNPLFNNNSIDSIKIETESYNFLTDETAIIVKSGSGTITTNLNYYNSRDFDNSLIEINGQFRTITEFVNETSLINSRNFDFIDFEVTGQGIDTRNYSNIPHKRFTGDIILYIDKPFTVDIVGKPIKIYIYGTTF